MNRKMMVMNKDGSMIIDFERKSKDRHEYC